MDYSHIPVTAQPATAAPASTPAAAFARATTKTPAAATGSPEEPTVALNNFMTSNEIHDGVEALTGEMIAALKKILGQHPTVRQALEMKRILLLIFGKMKDLGSSGDPAVIDQDTWIDEIEELAGSNNGLRLLTGVKIAFIIKDAPWGMQKQDGASSRDFARTINAANLGIERFLRALEVELVQMEQDGVTLMDHDVDDALSEVEPEELREQNTESEKLEASQHKDNGKGKQQQASNRKGTSSATAATAGGTTAHKGHGNHHHGKTVSWTNAEHIGLLQLYDIHQNRKLVSHAEIATMHNARWWQGDYVRTSAAVAQQFLRVANKDFGRIAGEIARMQAGIAAGKP